MVKELSLRCNFVASCLEIPFTRMDALKEHIRDDEKFKKIIAYVKSGWPSSKKNVEPVMISYFRIKEQISVLGGILLISHHILISESVRSSILSKIYYGNTKM